MRNPARCAFAVLIASFALAHGASAVTEEEEPATSEYVRTGFYAGGVIATVAFPTSWSGDFDGSLNDKATDLANQNAQANLDAIDPPGDEIIPLSITVDGAHLDDTQFGLNGVFGYRAGERVAFEVEGEWLVSSNSTRLDVTGSNGSHKASLGQVWTITANVKMYPPFLTGWYQPFAKVGLGVQHSQLDVDIESNGLSTTNVPGTIVVPANFKIRSSESSIDGAVRIGGGIDIYATPNVVAEGNVNYVVPFSKVGSVQSDYVTIQWRFIYRF